MTAKLSILMPTYNGARYCDQQIESILKQSFRDFELLVVDDGSRDDTVQRLTEAAAVDDRIRLFAVDGENRGQKIRLLELLAKAEGTLIGFADQDDIWEPQKLDRLIHGLGDAGLAFGPSRLIDEAGRSTGQTLHGALNLAIRPHDRLRSLVLPMVSAHGMIVRRELVSDVTFCQSVAFDWLITLDAQYTSGIRYVEDAVTLHRIHDGNQSNGQVLDKRSPLNWRSKVRLPRALLASGSIDRFSFLQRAFHLANSPALKPKVRRAFGVICHACEEAWFLKQGPFQRRNERCHAILMEQLQPFAGSPEDWRDGQNIIGLLTANWRTPSSRQMFR